MGMIPLKVSPPLPNDEPDERINGLTCEQCINGMTRADQGIKAIATRIKVIPTPSEPFLRSLACWLVLLYKPNEWFKSFILPWI